jgi:putative FmdB family regulatory protein
VPIYEYRCDECDHEHTEMRKVAERDTETKCPEGHAMKRKVSASSFSLKGSGWYRDGYS